MDWNRIEGNWKQFKGNVKEKWGKLTDDDINVINGRRDQLEGKIQERYGFEKNQARKDVDNWFKALHWPAATLPVIRKTPAKRRVFLCKPGRTAPQSEIGNWSAIQRYQRTVSKRRPIKEPPCNRK